MIADLASAADIAGLVERLDLVLQRLDEIGTRLPPTLEPIAVTAARYKKDPRTLVTAYPDAVVRIGRKIMFDPSRMRPVAPAVVAQLAREARR